MFLSVNRSWIRKCGYETFVNMKSQLRLLAWIFALLCMSLAPVTNAAEAWTLHELMAALAAQKTGEAQFVETKYLALLDRPVTARGLLFFQAPDQLEKRTLEPKRESLLLIGDLLTIERGARRQVLPLQNFPEVAVFIEGLRATLMGDTASLQQRFQIELSGTRQQWRLLLLPHDERALRMVQRIAITGSDATLQALEIQQADGDRSLMTITPLAITPQTITPLTIKPKVPTANTADRTTDHQP